MKVLDSIDLKILEILQRDSKISNKALAMQIGLSTSPTFERIRRLEKLGYIKKFVAICDAKKLNRNLEAFCQVSLQQHSEELIKKFEARIKQLPMVESCYHIAGNHDYLLRVRSTDMESFQDFIVKQLARIPNVSNVQSSFVMASVKDDTAIDLS